MRSKRTVLLIFVLASVLIFLACRKVDYQSSLYSNINGQSKFFDSHRSPDLLEKALVDFIGRENEKKNFVDATIKKIGFPYWDKAIKKTTTAHKHGRIESDSAYVVYVPFVRDSQNYVNASMAIYVDQEDTSYSFLCDWQYSGLHNTTSLTDTAEHYAVFFMMLDKAVFGHKRFGITDSTLFQFDQYRSYYVTMGGGNSTTGRNNLMTPITVCDDVTIYYFVQCPYPDSEECENGCDRCILCMDSYSYEYCWEDYIYTTGGGGSGSGTGGGSGSGSGGEPPPCPGGVTYRTEDVTDPCEPGWIPTGGGGSDPEPDPCAKVTWLKTDSLFKNTVEEFKTRLTENKEYAMLHKTGGGRIGAFQGIPGDCEVKASIYAPNTPMIKNYIHIHNNSCALPIFSPEDLKNISELLDINDHLYPQKDLLDSMFSFSLLTDSSLYVIVISDKQLFKNFANQFVYETSTSDMRALTKLYNTYDIKRANSQAENEKRFLQFLGKQNNNSGVGLRLLKANAGITGFDELILNRTKTGVISIPCN